MSKTRQRRRLLNVFAFALLAFAIYLVTFYKPSDHDPIKHHVGFKPHSATSQVYTAVK